ncbi:MAG TPA: type II secretion system F family protein [Acidimicrobiales bacterium]|nr:type II secretion system F family protein [Acidimicrobiales bacterium]
MSVIESHVISAYQYDAYRQDGSAVKGDIDAVSEAAARHALIERGLFPTRVVPKSATSGLSQKDFHFRKPKVKTGDVANFARLLSDMTGAGLSPSEALEAISRQNRGSAIQKAVSEVSSAVIAGEPMPSAFRASEQHFGPLTTAAVSAGEISGRMPDSLASLADVLEARVRTRRDVLTAAAYPSIVLGMSVVLIFGLLVFVIPTFKSLFDQLGGTLPLPTRLMLMASDAIRHFWYIVALLPFGAYFGFKYVRDTPGPRRRFDALFLRIPVIGPLNQQIINARIAMTLSTLLNAGVVQDRALELTADAAINKVYEDAVNDCARRVTEGSDLPAAMSVHGELFDPLMIQLAETGIRTGGTGPALARYGKITQTAVTRRIEALTSMIEPFLMIVFALMIGSAIIGIYLPLFKITTLIQ